MPSFRDMFRRASEDEKAQKRMESINKINLRGTTELFRAVERGDLAEVRKLIDDGAEIDSRSKSQGITSSVMFRVPYAAGSTALHAAALLGHSQIAELLLEKGADPNIRNNDGHTALDYALMSHAWMEDSLQKKRQSSFTLERFVQAAADKVGTYQQTVGLLLSRGSKTGLLELPERFKDLLPRRRQKPQDGAPKV
ncbi:MAG: ankyrin repeat domain-containing protein [Alphaproteobacteria bacterium]|jgi:hypothetical protein